MGRETRCGYIAIIGRPNVGKSTLVNDLLGQKLSITSDKPQTTRYQILGIKTHQDTQAIYVDTPGIHKLSARLVNRHMNRAALSAIPDADVIVFMVDARYWTDEDEMILEKLVQISKPVVLALNKIDLLKDKKTLLPLIDKISQKKSFAEIIPLSVLRKIQVDVLEQEIEKRLPANPFFFPEEKVTDRGDSFFVSEIIREKIMRVTGAEVPYDTAVVIEEMKVKNSVLHIRAIIWVARAGQKAILIGAKGEKMKQIGTMARGELEEKFKCQVFLGLWVKVKAEWSDDEKMVTSLFPHQA